jgi:hypothetical protein
MCSLLFLVLPMVRWKPPLADRTSCPLHGPLLREITRLGGTRKESMLQLSGPFLKWRALFPAGSRAEASVHCRVWGAVMHRLLREVSPGPQRTDLHVVLGLWLGGALRMRKRSKEARRHALLVVR